MKTKLILINILLVLCLILPACGTLNDPLDEMYTQDVLPGTHNTYDVGAVADQYLNGYFQNLFLNGVPVVPGGAEVDPVFTASPSFGITALNIAAWNGLVSSQWDADITGIHYDLGNVGIGGNSDDNTNLLISSYSGGLLGNTVLDLHDNCASAGTTGLNVFIAGGKSDDTYGGLISVLGSSGTAGINKYGLYIRSDGVWSGIGSTNYSLYISTPSGGTNNYATYTQGGYSYFGGHLGVMSAPSDIVGVNFDETKTITDNNNNIALMGTYRLSKTAADYAGVATGVVGQVSVTAANNKDWTLAFGVRGFDSRVTTDPGSTGTIKDAINYYGLASIDGAGITNRYGAYILDATGAGTLTNQYGIYLESMTKGTTLNYSIYSAGGANYLGGSLRLGSQLDQIEIATPANPPANTLRIFTEDTHGFSVYKYLDDTGMKRELVRDSVIIVKNVTGSPILKNRFVYATGSSDNVPTVDLAKSDVMATMPAIGVTLEAIADGAFGRVMQVGMVENVNSNAFNEGDVLYISDTTAGEAVSTPPLSPHLTQEMGTVLVKNVATGSVQIIARGLTGNEHGTIQNTFYIGDGLAGSKTLTFNAVADASIVWDETKFNIGSTTFTGTLTVPTPFTIGAVSMTTTGTQLNYLNAATGTTGTTNTKLVFSDSPTFTGTTALPIVTTTGTLTMPNNAQLIFKTTTAADWNALTLDTTNTLRLAFNANPMITMWGGGTFGTGNSLILIPAAATAGATLKNSPTLNLRATYWNGAASTNWAYEIINTMTATTPASTVSHAINSVNILQLTNTNGVASLTFGGIPRFNGTNTTAAGTALLGANCPAVTVAAPYTWIQVVTSDGSTAYVPAWK